MSDFHFEPMRLDGMCKVFPFVSEDERGTFVKWYEREALSRAGMSGGIWEHFTSYSKRGVLRGLHIGRLHPQAKLVYLLCGEVFDVGVDLRPDSETYGQWEGVHLSDKTPQAVFLPAGFAHGFFVRSEFAVVGYLCQGWYEKEGDSGVRWDDPRLAISWGLSAGEVPILSERDRHLPDLTAYERSGRI